MTDQPDPTTPAEPGDGFDRDRLGLPTTSTVTHGPDEECTCLLTRDVEAAELVVSTFRQELNAELVLLIAPVTGSAACISTPWGPRETAAVLRVVANDLDDQARELARQS